MDWQMVQGIGEVAAALAATAAIWASFRLHKQQAAATNTLHQQQMDLTDRIHREEQLLNQRQLLLPLWQHMGKIKDIDTDPAKTNWFDVVDLMNALELVALCWEAQAIDPAIIRRTFRDKYIYLYEKIGECKNPPSGDGWKPGKQLLQENKAARKLYEDLKKELNDQDAIQPIGKK